MDSLPHARMDFCERAAQQAKKLPHKIHWRNFRVDENYLPYTKADGAANRKNILPFESTGVKEK
jgi:hypothetical protein